MSDEAIPPGHDPFMALPAEQPLPMPPSREDVQIRRIWAYLVRWPLALLLGAVVIAGCSVAIMFLGKVCWILARLIWRW